ncbi:MAG: hypothetical protein H6Q33_4135 [Deltaproteobacteria bacterium]|nr:hypothetical protein [Deltaproteobacteria bacterium]
MNDKWEDAMLNRVYRIPLVRISFIIGAVAVLSACGSVTIVQPANNAATALNPVVFKVTIGADRSSHTITLTNTATSQAEDLVNGPRKLTRTDGVNAPDSYDGQLNLAAGNYRIDASGVNAGRSLSATSTFKVTATTQMPALSFSTSGPIALDVGATTQVNLSRPAPPSGAVTVTLSASPANRVMLPPTASFGPTDTSAQFDITGQTVGSTQLSASATGYTAPTVLTVNVQQPVGLLLYRSHASGVETYRFTPGPNGGSFQRVASTSSTMSPGLMVVGLDRKGTTLIRSGSQGFEVYTIGGTVASPTLTLAGSAPSTGQGSPALAGSGTDAAISQNVWARAIGFGIETWQPGTGTLTQYGSSSVGGGATAGQALLADPNYPRILRSTPSSLEIWDISTPSTPQRTTNNISVFAAQTVSDIAWLDPGRRLVRSHTNGIQIIDVDQTVTPPTLTIGGSNSTGGGTFGAVAVASNATLVARATGQGLELYALWPTGNPTRCGTSNQGNASAAGVSLASGGTWVFRATATSIESYDMSGLTCPQNDVTTTQTLPVKIFTTGVIPATTGLGLAGPN